MIQYTLGYCLEDFIYHHIMQLIIKDERSDVGLFVSHVIVVRHSQQTLWIDPRSHCGQHRLIAFGMTSSILRLPLNINDIRFIEDSRMLMWCRRFTVVVEILPSRNRDYIST